MHIRKLVRKSSKCTPVVPIANTCSIGYPHDGRADNTAYRHDRRADNAAYRHDRRADSLSQKLTTTKVHGNTPKMSASSGAPWCHYPPFLHYSPFLHYRLVSSFQKSIVENTGNQNHPDLKVRVVLVTCISYIDFL